MTLHRRVRRVWGSKGVLEGDLKVGAGVKGPPNFQTGGPRCSLIYLCPFLLVLRFHFPPVLGLGRSHLMHFMHFM